MPTPILPLVCGVAGGENGQAYIYKRGTSAAATWYADYDGTSPVSTGAALSLDANGARVVYVNEPVTVEVYASAVNGGGLVRRWTDQAAATATEVVSPSFTGSDYATAASAANKPVVMSTIMDRWLAKNGRADWEISVAGQTGTIPDILSQVLGLVWNVKAEDYGAVGDGVADDTSAIIDAVAAANAAGRGIVFLPPGTYKVTSEIDIPAGVSIVGSGPYASIITMDHATADTLDANGSAFGRVTTIANLALAASRANNGTLIKLGASSETVISTCLVGDGVRTTGTGVWNTGGGSRICTMRGCTLSIAASGDAVSMASGASNIMTMHGCRVTTGPGVASGHVVSVVGRLNAVSCVFDMAGVASGNVEAVHVTAYDDGDGASILGCRFTSPSGGAVSAMRFDRNSGDARFTESGNHFESGVTAYEYNTATASYVDLGSRDKRFIHIQDNAGAITLPTDQFGVILLERTVTGAAALTAHASVPIGAELFLIVHNNGSGGTVSVGMTSGWAADVSPVVSDNTTTCFHFVAREQLTGGSARRWEKVAAHLSKAEV